ncbi:MAG: SfnB family sulfur acquisition oxidoreductase [Kineosporiaceae bacterium]
MCPSPSPSPQSLAPGGEIPAVRAPGADLAPTPDPTPDLGLDTALDLPDSPQAHVVRDDDEAVRVAEHLVPVLAAGAAQRDRERRLPVQELALLSASGLLGITVPMGHGGAEVRTSTVAEVVRLLALADPNIAQIPHSHFVYVNVLRTTGGERLRARLYADVLAGRRLGNAQAEAGTKHAGEHRTALRRRPDGTLSLTGVKNYCTGALFAHWIPVLARDEADRAVAAFVPRHAPGVTVVDDWDGMGQRTTASGTVRLDDVTVEEWAVAPHHETFTGPQLHGARAQLLHAAIDVGLARAALLDAVDAVLTKARPWYESTWDRAADDPLVIQQVGELEVQVRASEELLRAAGRAVDDAAAHLDDDSAARASIAVAVAKTHATRTCLTAGDAVLDLGGTRCASDRLNLHRHWRNARMHTLHDPVRWKLQHIGRYAIDGTRPPRHGQI